jgi:hypothetical protein
VSCVLNVVFQKTITRMTGTRIVVHAGIIQYAMQPARAVIVTTTTIRSYHPNTVIINGGGGCVPECVG